jgi:hypothetical protein
MSKTKKNLITMLCIATMMLTLVACGSKNEVNEENTSSDDSQNVTSESDSNVKDDVVVSESESVEDNDESDVASSTTESSTSNMTGTISFEGVEYKLPCKYQPIQGYETSEDFFYSDVETFYLVSTSDNTTPIKMNCPDNTELSMDTLEETTIEDIKLDLRDTKVAFVLDGVITETSTKNDVLDYYGDKESHTNDDGEEELFYQNLKGDRPMEYTFTFDENENLCEVFVQPVE